MDIAGDRLLVHYSVSFGDRHRADALTRQLDTSLTTLRATNPEVDVVVFCHGSKPEVVTTVAHRHGVRLAELPDPFGRLQSELGPLGALLGRFGPIHKFLNLVELAELAPVDTLYLDADTIVFGDLQQLVPADERPQLVAREEVGSLRCRFAAQPGYLDEAALAATLASRGCHAPAPAFNTGVMLFHRFPWQRAAAFERRYLAWMARFAIWMADHPADPASPEYAEVFDVATLRGLLDGQGARLRRLGAAYPSRNRWLVEEAAAWIALGHERDVEPTVFDPALVAQGGEPLDGPLPGVVWHYFSSNQDGMERRLGLRTTNTP